MGPPVVGVLGAAVAKGCVGNCGKKFGLVLSNLLGEVKAELRMGDPVI